jgi:hypothetical protein
MHHLRQFLQVCALLLPLVVVTGCSDGTAPQRDSRFSGSWAGMPWLGEAEALFLAGTPNTDTLYLFGVRPSNTGQYPEEIIRLRVPFNGPGAYELAGDAVEFTVLVGGDVVSAQYAGQSPTAGTLTVDSYDPAAGVITGTVLFAAVAVTQFRPYGPAARFEGGRFRVHVRRMT